jgi:hypothetical protein
VPATTAQVAPAQEAGRPQPQTTVQPPGHPFITYAQPGKRLQYQSTGNALGGQINNPLVATPGYIRAFRIRVNASGGSATANITAQPDAPWSVFSNVQLYDSFGTPLIIAPGYEALKLVPKYGGQGPLGFASNPENLPSWSAMGLSSNTAGNFTFQSWLPLEVVKGVGTISGANASLLPRLQWTLGGLSSVVTTATTANQTTNPSVEVDVNTDFYWLPDGQNIEPPGLGTTCQWVLQQANPTIGSTSTTRVQLPRFGGYISTLIFILRDANGARVDGWGTRTRIYVDGVPLIDVRDDEWKDDMAAQFGLSNFQGSNTFTTPIETGVRVLTRKTSLGQNVLGLFDTGETFLSTNPGTLIEVEGAPWGTISSGPGTLNILAGLVVPVGSMVTGLPEV